MSLRIMILPVLIMTLSSCEKYRLSDSDLAWQPYKVGDQLIFESSRDERDSIVIESIEVYTNPDDPLDIFPYRIETLFVNASKEILKLEAGKSGSYVQFKLRLGEGNLISPWVILDLTKDEIDRLEVTEFVNKKAYKIVAKESVTSLKDRSFDLRYIYWSKDYGYLGLEFKDGYTWKLKSFTRNKKDIL